VLKGPAPASSGVNIHDRKGYIEAVRQALYASKICSYAQGFVQLQAAAKEHDWKLNYGDIALLWRGGCIIRAAFLQRIKDAFDKQADLENLLLDPYFTEATAKAQSAWRQAVISATLMGLPVIEFTNALAYYDSFRRASLPANLLQAQRDYFGAHTYQRIDQPLDKKFHSEWLDLRRQPRS
jgi:6-phosphogluconate dehydrogenase